MRDAIVQTRDPVRAARPGPADRERTRAAAWRARRRCVRRDDGSAASTRSRCACTRTSRRAARRRRSARGRLAQWGNRALALVARRALRCRHRRATARADSDRAIASSTAARSPRHRGGLGRSSRQKLIRKFDSEANFRTLVGPVGMLVTTLAVVLSSFHIYTAGFGLLDEIKHRSFHLTLVLGLVLPRVPAPAPCRARPRWCGETWAWGRRVRRVLRLPRVGPRRRGSASPASSRTAGRSSR